MRTLAGQVSHLALERIAQALHAERCTDPQDLRVGRALRAVGGITGVLESCGDQIVTRHRDDPRTSPYLDELRAELWRQLPTLRALVQGSLQRIFGTSASPPEGTTSVPTRSALPPGFHPEVLLSPPAMQWVGYADAIKLGPEQCEIIDFKTGSEDPSHHEQVRIYALLWARDSVVNPHARLATHLTLVYPGMLRAVDVPDAAALDLLESDLAARAEGVLRELATTPPPAFVSAETCRFCDVKHLCADYWEDSSRPLLAAGDPGTQRAVEIQILQQKAVRSWRVAVVHDPWIPQGTEALLVGIAHPAFLPSARLRLIDCRVADQAGDDPLLIQRVPTTEIFVLDED